VELAEPLPGTGRAKFRQRPRQHVHLAAITGTAAPGHLQQTPLHAGVDDLPPEVPSTCSQR
jgi:hypothetical protein